MNNVAQQIKRDAEAVLTEFKNSGHLADGDVFVIGCSTSEVVGKHIGTSGSEEAAATIFEALNELQRETGVLLAFQCCEHLNRSLVVEKDTMKKHLLDEVSAVPVPGAGGSMASYAYRHMKSPVLVETIHADSGIDIGETMIGMHLKHVAVPLRFEQRTIGQARINAARTRPKLIGGKRAVYEPMNEAINPLSNLRGKPKWNM
ncbi:TIGR01440 family protein [Virgibacillus siamensis]|uniref:TIGR01440 family protein n=1 Tax=Virgibacillus siamensis TaxID=480071 RepID=UPI000986FBB5|nr:TIGR01440 family protein [Virgibacillus siamensis]